VNRLFRKLTVKSKIWVELDARPVFGDGKARLLQAVAETGSIRAAAQRLRMSYRAAWGRLREMERRLGAPLAVRRAGGLKGGGSQLTPFGTELLRRYLRFRRGLNAVVDERFERAVAEV
jgi:molybdate transport system regulatory protein